MIISRVVFRTSFHDKRVFSENTAALQMNIILFIWSGTITLNRQTCDAVGGRPGARSRGVMNGRISGSTIRSRWMTEETAPLQGRSSGVADPAERRTPPGRPISMVKRKGHPPARPGAGPSPRREPHRRPAGPLRPERSPRRRTPGARDGRWRCSPRPRPASSPGPQ